MGYFEELRHTADLRMRFYGKDLTDLFVTAAQGLYSLILEEPQIHPQETIPLEICADNQEELLIQWLRMLLYQWNGEGYVVGGVRICEITQTRVKASCQRVKFDPAQHKILHEVKAVTYCDLSVMQQKDGSWKAEVVFDV